MHVDITGKEIKVGQQVVVCLDTEQHIATVTKLTPKKVRIEQSAPKFNTQKDVDEWYEDNCTINGLWFPYGIYIIQ